MCIFPFYTEDVEYHVLPLHTYFILHELILLVSILSFFGLLLPLKVSYNRQDFYLIIQTCSEGHVGVV